MLWISENEQRDFFKKRNANIIVTNEHVKSLQWWYIEALTSKVATNFDCCPSFKCSPSNKPSAMSGAFLLSAVLKKLFAGTLLYT